VSIVAITDIHGRTNFDNKIAHVITNADIILIAGDITNFGGEKEARLILQNITALNMNVLAVPGNCDQLSVNHVIIDQGFNLHGEMKMIGNIAFYGIGGCSKTPFHTPQEYSESKIEELLSSFEKKENARFHILISHTPPYGTKVDKMFLGIHVGSKAIRNFIETFRPDIVICGHIHEASGSDKIGKTIIINPGPFPKHYAVINLGDKVDYELY